MRTITYHCDGCDKTETMAPESDILPDSWDRLRMAAIRENGHEAATTEMFDLCPRCRQWLNEQTDPRKWPRAAEAPADG